MFAIFGETVDNDGGSIISGITNNLKACNIKSSKTCGGGVVSPASQVQK